MPPKAKNAQKRKETAKAQGVSEIQPESERQGGYIKRIAKDSGMRFVKGVFCHLILHHKVKQHFYIQMKGSDIP